MRRFSDPADFVCGTYLIEFDSRSKASDFIARLNDCPLWPIMTRGPGKNQVFVLAVELRRQSLGDFSEEHNQPGDAAGDRSHDRYTPEPTDAS